MIIGFTGTEKGMTDEQKEVLKVWLESEIGPLFSGDTYDCTTKKVRHGMCIGADFEINQICLNLGILTFGHPGTNKFGKIPKKAEMIVEYEFQSKPYLERNKDIVNASDELWAAPYENEEQLRSGVWSTIRYAQKKEKPVAIFLPNGVVI